MPVICHKQVFKASGAGFGLGGLAYTHDYRIHLKDSRPSSHIGALKMLVERVAFAQTSEALVKS